jgi:methyl-accepting chemotaxis protein
VKNLRIGPRIYLIVGILLVTGIVSLAIAYQGMTEIRTTYDRTFTDRAPVARVIDNIRIGVPEERSQINSLLVPDHKKTWYAQQIKDARQVHKDFDGYMADWESNATKGASPAEQKAFAELKPALNAWWDAIDEFVVHIEKWDKTGDANERQIAFKTKDDGKLDVTQKTMQAAVAKLVEVNTAENKRAQAEAKAEQQAAMTRLATIVGLLTLFGVGCAVVISGSITGPLTDAVKFADAVAAGDFSARVVTRTGGETGELTKAIEEMKDSLVTRMEQMHEVAALVELAADGVTGTAADVIDAAQASGDASLVEKGERLAKQAGNLKGALSAFGGGSSAKKADAA